jgi:hypothetical protein
VIPTGSQSPIPHHTKRKPLIADVARDMRYATLVELRCIQLIVARCTQEKGRLRMRIIYTMISEPRRESESIRFEFIQVQGYTE